jgi:hypothetical protein
MKLIGLEEISARIRFAVGVALDRIYKRRLLFKLTKTTPIKKKKNMLRVLLHTQAHFFFFFFWKEKKI